MTDEDEPKIPHPAEASNRIANTLIELHVFVPLSVRYRAAAAAMAVVNEWLEDREARKTFREAQS